MTNVENSRVNGSQVCTPRRVVRGAKRSAAVLLLVTVDNKSLRANDKGERQSSQQAFKILNK
jgi:hypothetical protein